MQNLQKDKKGFTIIEVLIVIAIAGLIIMIVFLAVPALQRNSRNTTIRNDAAAVLSGVNEYQAANNGKMPTTVSVSDTDVTISGGASTNSVVAKVKSGTTVSVGNTAPAGTGSIAVAFDTGCNGTAPVSKNRAIAALYLVETGTTDAPQCTES